MLDLLDDDLKALEANRENETKKARDISNKLVDSIFSPLVGSKETYCFNSSRNIGCK